MSADPASDARRVAEKLLGTCDGLINILEQLDMPEDLQDDETFCATLDDAIFCCAICGWWYEISEANDAMNGTDFICDDCKG